MAHLREDSSTATNRATGWPIIALLMLAFVALMLWLEPWTGAQPMVFR